MFILSLTVGSMFVMWLGEQISLFGLGNGSSMIIFAGIVARLPEDALKSIYQVQQGLMNGYVTLVIVYFLLLLLHVLYFLKKVNVKFRFNIRVVLLGKRVYGGQSTYIPFKINVPGVMPVIFAGAVLNIPMFVAAMLSERFALFKWISESMVPTGILYNIIEFFLLFSFHSFILL